MKKTTLALVIAAALAQIGAEAVAGNAPPASTVYQITGESFGLITPGTTRMAPISWCDDMQGNKWGEYGTACHLNPRERRPARCGLEDAHGNLVPLQETTAGCSIPRGFEAVPMDGPEWNNRRQH